MFRTMQHETECIIEMTDLGSASHYLGIEMESGQIAYLTTQSMLEAF